jgi:hypothetical protein
MTQAGVNFKNLESPAVSPLSTAGGFHPILLLAAFFMIGGRHRHPEPWFEIDHLIRRWLEVEHDKVNRKTSEIALAVLQRKYADTDPFDRYQLETSAATMELRRLVAEHTLPDNSPSPWRRLWEQQLETMQSYSRPLVGSPDDDQQLRKWCFRMADSTLKQNISDPSGADRPWGEFVQRLFERKWIVTVAEMAVNANRGEKPTWWTVESLHSLIADVVVDLNHIGYALVVPGIERIANLMHLLAARENVYSTDW